MRMTLDCYLWSKRRAGPWLLFAMVGGLVILSILDHRGYGWYAGGLMHRFNGRTFSVERVIDGDTLVIWDARERESVRVRLWGVDTPELAKRRRHIPAQPYAQAAREFTLQQCQGQLVRLELESHRLRGTYGRLLCYVWLKDGSMLNEQLLIHGLARHDRRFAHRYETRFALLEQQARHNHVGLWRSRRQQKLASP